MSELDPSPADIDAALHALALPDARASPSLLVADVIELREAMAMLAYAAAPAPPPSLLWPRIERSLSAPLAPSERRSREPDGARAALIVASLAGSLGIVAAAAATLLWVDTRGQLHARVHERDRARADAATVRAPDLTLATFHGKEAGVARVLAAPARHRWLVLAFELPAVAGRDYQLWFVPATGAPVSAGLMQLGADGVLDASVAVPPGLGAVRPAISLEPRGGSPLPTDVKMVGEIL